MKIFNQLEFSTLLFDTIYGLILFYSFDSLLEIHNPLILLFYLFSMFVLVHWWLIFKSTDDSFEEEVTDSAADIVFGIIYTIILYYLVQYSRSADVRVAALFLVGLFIIDLLWALIWRYVGAWRTSSQAKIKTMEFILDQNILLDIAFALGYSALLIIGNILSSAWFIIIFVALYLLYIALTFKTKILNIDIF